MFKSLFGKPKEKIKQIDSKEITCPYCFSRFWHNEVHFRASKNNGIEGDVSYGIIPDSDLINWYDKFQLGEPEDMNIVIKAEDVGEDKRQYIDGVLMGVTDFKDNFTKKRLCPDCHNELPATAGKAPIHIVSVIGTTKSGKSVYLTTLINQLIRHTASNMGASIIPVSQKIKDLYQKKYYSNLYVKGEMLEATKTQMQPPLIYHLNFNNDPNKQDVTLCFFDVAGEAVTNGELLDIQSSNIRHSDSLMFLVDPTNLDSIKQRISLGARKEFETINLEDDPSSVVTALFEDFISFEEGGKTKKPTAVVLTKSDLLHSLTDEFEEYVQKNSNMFQNFVHKKQFNTNVFQNVNGEVKQFISQVDPQLLQQLNSYFDNIGFFAVSALGSEPLNENENGKLISKVNGIVNSYRVDEPLLWLLYKQEFINGGVDA